jgi:hypothetical protein
MLMDWTPLASRRDALKVAGSLGLAAGALEIAGPLSFVPERPRVVTRPSDIQFDIAAFLTAQPHTYGSGTKFQMPPVHTVFLTAKLRGRPTASDQAGMQRALADLERHYPWGAAGLVTFLAYGVPYFRRLPGGMHGRLVRRHMPRLLAGDSRYVLEEAVPAPTDFGPQNPGISKLRYKVPVAIEHNDLLFTLRSDNPRHIEDVLAWFGGSGTLRGEHAESPGWERLVHFTSSRYMFVQPGLPNRVAHQAGLPYAAFIQDRSPMWMGFADQQTNGSGPAAICTFAGNSAARFTTAAPGDYFDNGSVQHLSHVILDMLQFFDMAGPAAPPGEDGTFTERVQYMFHAPNIAAGNADQYLNGGGPAFLPNENRGPHYAQLTARGIGTNVSPGTGKHERRMGHLSCLQRSSRAADGTPVHIRMDGPGFDSMDVPDGSRTPKLQFTIFVPSADFFATMRTSQASLDLQHKYHVSPSENGLERFITATRRQNFLVPPRRHRAFPLAEFE